MNEFKRHNFKKLKIWQMGLELSKLTLDQTDTFPTYEKYGLKSQMDRCSISVPSNIAEGSSRTNKSFSHFLDISLGSSFELQTQILLANHRKYLSDEQSEIFEIKIEEFQRATMVFQNTLKDQKMIDGQKIDEHIIDINLKKSIIYPSIIYHLK